MHQRTTPADQNTSRPLRFFRRASTNSPGQHGPDFSAPPRVLPHSPTAGPAVPRPADGGLRGKVQSLLGGYPKLANDVSASREAIWGVLTDPVKFRSLS